MIALFLAEGFEEAEAVIPCDILRRGGVEVVTCSVTDKREVVGSHGIPVLADTVIADLAEPEGIILPGGMPGTTNLFASAELQKLILRLNGKKKLLCAICAAPTVYGKMGLLKEEEATCYPGMEKELFAKTLSEKSVCRSGNFVTSRGPGTAFDFGFEILEILKGKDIAQALRAAMCQEVK